MAETIHSGMAFSFSGESSAETHAVKHANQHTVHTIPAFDGVFSAEWPYEVEYTDSDEQRKRMGTANLYLATEFCKYMDAREWKADAVLLCNGEQQAFVSTGAGFAKCSATAAKA